MQKTARERASEKVVSKACKWLDSRNAKAALTGAALDVAKSRQRVAESELAEAAEKYLKEK